MLKSLSYAVKKRLSINIMLCELYNKKQDDEITSFNDLHSSIEKMNFLPNTDVMNIKNGFLFDQLYLNYEITKEKLTNTFFISFPNIVILHVLEQDYPLFLEKHKNSDMLFYSYKYDHVYHIICVSHLRSDIQTPFLEFLHENYCHPSFIVLSSRFSSFLVLNENYKQFYNRFTCNKFLDKRIKYQEEIGRGSYNYLYLKYIIDFVNCYNKDAHLPTSYLKLPY